MAESHSDSLVILLHGVGSNGKDIGSLAQTWQDALPQTRFAAPNAPEASSFGSGYQWFSVAAVTEENRPGRVAGARTTFDATISHILGQYGFSNRLDRVAFVGFSQGTIMGLDAIASGRWPVAGLVGYSGRMASPAPLAPSPKTAVLLIHGEADRLMPPSETRTAAATLESYGVHVEKKILPYVEHQISREGALLGCDFLVNLFKV
jgi:phospholipase/carboxylesterase